MRLRPFFFIFIIVSTVSCTAPRTIINSGKTTPKGNVAGGYHYSLNFSTQTVVLLKDIVVDNVNSLAKKDSISFDANFENINKGAVAYQLDPIKSANEFYLKYGILKRWDAGVKISGNAKGLETQFQFLGPTGKFDVETPHRVYGSVALQYTTQSQSLPSILGKIQSRLGYNFKRQDFLLPLIFSYSIGNEEKFGALSIGGAVNYSIINYSTTPIDIYNIDKTKLEAQKFKQEYMSFGLFANLKLGYKYVYLLPSLSMFYQNYGEYHLLNGNTTKLKGFTFIPGLGINFNIGKASQSK